jgi:hypothetical protein
MIDEMSYSNGITCVLECARQAKRDAAFPTLYWICALHSQTEMGSASALRVSRFAGRHRVETLQQPARKRSQEQATVSTITGGVSANASFLYVLLSLRQNLCIQGHLILFNPIQAPPPGGYMKERSKTTTPKIQTIFLKQFTQTKN